MMLSLFIVVFVVGYVRQDRRERHEKAMRKLGNLPFHVDGPYR